MGKLRDSLTNAGKLVNGVEKAVTRFTNQMGSLAEDAGGWRDSGWKGIEEFSLYMLEKLKKKNIEIKSVENDLIKDHMDGNVANYLNGIKFTVQSASDFSARFEAVSGDQSFDNDLAALQKVLKDVADQIGKKKKKLLQSKKYKAKIAGYDKTLQDLQAKVTNLKATLKQMRKDKPPSPARLQQQLSITENSRLKDLLAGLSMSKQNLHKEYNSLVLNLNQTQNEMRKHAEFAGHMKVLQEMLAEAEEMDKD